METQTPITIPILMEDLLGLPTAIAQAEAEVLRAAFALEREEAHLLLCGEITGKNEAERKAQLAQRTEPLALELGQLKVHLHHLQARFAARRSLARLLAGGE